jgi:uncharacterized protein with GYD domain
VATFITLYKFTGPIKGGGPERFKKFNGIVESEGGKILQFYGLMGEHDVITICDYPSIRAAMKAAAAIGNLIGAQTRTMPALEKDEFLKLLTELG